MDSSATGFTTAATRHSPDSKVPATDASLGPAWDADVRVPREGGASSSDRDRVDWLARVALRYRVPVLVAFHILRSL